MPNDDTTLTREEAAAIYETLQELTGHSPENIFAWDGSDSPNDTTSRAWAKIFKAIGLPVPAELR